MDVGWNYSSILSTTLGACWISFEFLTPSRCSCIWLTSGMILSSDMTRVYVSGWQPLPFRFVIMVTWTVRSSTSWPAMLVIQHANGLVSVISLHLLWLSFFLFCGLRGLVTQRSNRFAGRSSITVKVCNYKVPGTPLPSYVAPKTMSIEFIVVPSTVRICVSVYIDISI